MKCLVLFFLSFLKLRLIFFFDTVSQYYPYLSFLKLVDSPTWDQIDKNRLLNLERVEFLLQHLVDKQPHNHSLYSFIGVVTQSPKEGFAYFFHFRVFGRIVNSLPFPLKEFHDLKHSEIHPFFHRCFHQVNYIACLFREVHLGNLQVFLAVITLFVAISSSEVFSEVVQKNFPTAEVRLLAELDYFVKRM